MLLLVSYCVAAISKVALVYGSPDSVLNTKSFSGRLP